MRNGHVRNKGSSLNVKPEGKWGPAKQPLAHLWCDTAIFEVQEALWTSKHKGKWGPLNSHWNNKNHVKPGGEVRAAKKQFTHLWCKAALFWGAKKQFECKNGGTSEGRQTSIGTPMVRHGHFVKCKKQFDCKIRRRSEGHETATGTPMVRHSDFWKVQEATWMQKQRGKWGRQNSYWHTTLLEVLKLQTWWRRKVE